MSRIRKPTHALSLLPAAVLLAACADEAYTYELMVEVQASAETLAETSYPAVLEVIWDTRVHRVDLLCQDPGTALSWEWEGMYRTIDYSEVQIVTARLAPVDLDGACRESLPLADVPEWNGVDDGTMPWVQAAIFPVQPQGSPEAVTIDEALLVLSLED